jgi:hypothetical protein
LNVHKIQKGKILEKDISYNRQFQKHRAMSVVDPQTEFQYSSKHPTYYSSRDTFGFTKYWPVFCDAGSSIEPEPPRHEQ